MNKEIVDDFKDMIKDNRISILAAIAIVFCASIILPLAAWYVKENPRKISPHESEEVCNEMGGDYLRYSVMMSGSVPVPIYKCMEIVDEDGKRKEIDERR